MTWLRGRLFGVDPQEPEPGNTGGGKTNLNSPKENTLKSEYTNQNSFRNPKVLAEMAMGSIVDKFSWDGGFIMLIISCVLAIFFLSFTWNTHNIKEKIVA